MDNTSILIVSLLFVWLVYIVLDTIKHFYLTKQWKKLLKESEEVKEQNLSGQELAFELEYLISEQKRIEKLETKLFPYL